MNRAWGNFCECIRRLGDIQGNTIVSGTSYWVHTHADTRNEVPHQLEGKLLLHLCGPVFNLRSALLFLLMVFVLRAIHNVLVIGHSGNSDTLRQQQYLGYHTADFTHAKGVFACSLFICAGVSLYKFGFNA